MTAETKAPAEALCTECGKRVTFEERALTKKLINRGTTQYRCCACLAAHFGVTETELHERAEYFRKTGCTLFDPAADPLPVP